MRDVIPRHEIPGAPILTVAQALEAFQVQKGFVVEPVVSEPDVFNPVAMAFDASGRMWVAEMTTYMPDVHGSGEMKPDGNIALLEDTDGDGAVDRRTVLLDNVLLPRTVAVVDGGIFYADHESLYFAEVLEADGQVRLGRHDVVDPTYASGGNVEHKPNTMLYGIDGWYYNAKSDRRYRVLPLGAEVPAGAEEIYRNTDWKVVRAGTDYRGQWGLSMDDYGRLYHNGNSSPIHGEYLLPGALLKNPGYWPDMPAHPIGDNFVFPARINPGVNRGYLEGTLVADGPDRGKLVSFTAASGSLVYRGSNFPAAYYGMGLTPEPAANLVSARRIIEANGELRGEALFPGQELLASTDERFRPVNLYNAPDGTVYILDMYHGIIQHRDFLTRYLADQIRDRELDHGNNTMGRVYRLRWAENRAAPVPDLDALDSASLVPYLAHANAWQRDTARRLLVERQASSVANAIRALMAGSDHSVALVNALWTLHGLGAVDIDTVRRYMRDADHHVAMAAAAVGEALPASDHAAYHQSLRAMANAGYPRALQAAVSVAAIDGGADVSRLVLDAHIDRPYTREAVVSGLGDDAAAFVEAIGGAYPDPVFMDMLDRLGENRQQASNRDRLSPAGQRRYDRGQALYAGQGACAGCHGPHGNGMPGLGPTFWDSGWVYDRDRLVRVLLHGLAGPIWVGQDFWNTAAVMPGYATNDAISDEDLAAMATYIRNSWGNAMDSGDAVTESDIEKVRAQTQGRVEPFRATDFE
ncbi:c-type cytochrome [Marinihelvus fidelis]|uniref:C-type cytochrome n=2 Tax=Marinihelvus fidelis TaxID=2613842 RepID=A0A5N0TI03_9GAMM|nr:c-type cytochrome [Marinihelvus fidelis]